MKNIETSMGYEENSINKSKIDNKSKIEKALESKDTMSRRKFLGGLAAVSAAVALGMYFDSNRKPDTNEIDVNKKSENAPKAKTKEQIEQERIRKLTLERVDIEVRHIIENNNYKDLTTDIARVNTYNKSFQEYGKKHSVNPDFLKGLVFVESKGDPGAYNKGSGATGLCQFTETTAKEFDLANRENPYQSIEAAAKFISYYQNFLGSQDLAVASFHMGYGNMYDIISSFIKPDKIAKFPKEAVLAKKLDYFKLYFGSDRNLKPDTHHILFEKLEDDSANYIFKILASVAIMNLQKTDPAKLKSLYNKENRLV